MSIQTQHSLETTRPLNIYIQLGLRLAAILILGYLILVGGGVTSNADWQWQASTWVLAISLSAIWLIWRVGLHKAAWPITGLEVTLLIGFTSAGLSWWFSPDWRMGAARLLQLLGFLLVFYVAVDCLDAGAFAEIVIDALILISGLALAIGLLEVYAFYQGRWGLLGVVEWYRPVTLLGHPNLLMGLANLILPFVGLAWRRYQNVFSRTGLILWCFCYVATTPFASSRGAMLGLVVMIVVGLIGLVSQRQSATTEKVIGRLRGGIWWLAGAGALVIVVLVGLFLYQSSYGSHGGVLSRFVIWQIAAQVIANNFWLGAGPGRFGFEAARYGAVPPGFWPIHAHSVFWQTFGEFGLLGVGAFSILVGRFSGLVAQAIRQTTGRARWPAVAGGLALLGYGIQNVVDDQTHVIATMIPLMLVCAVVLTVRPVTRGRGSLAWLSIPLVVGGAVQGQWLRAYAAFDQGRQYYQAGQWSAALDLIQSAQSQDSGLAFYDSSAGLVAARLGNWPVAQTYFENAARIEDGLAMAQVNVGLARWQNGDRAGGLAALQRAVVIAPGSETIQYILGQMAETLDETSLAEESYQQVVLIRPDWHTHEFWQSTPTRQQSWLAAPRPTLTNMEAVADVKNALASGNVGMARGLLDNYFSQGDSWQPRKIRMILLAGDVAIQDGQIDPAMRLYQKALISLANPSLEGSGAAFWTRYGIWLYEREPLPIDLAPGWPLLDYRPNEDLSRFEKLLDWAAEHWPCAESRSIAQAVNDLQPGHQQSQAILAIECQ